MHGDFAGHTIGFARGLASMVSALGQTLFLSANTGKAYLAENSAPCGGWVPI